MPYDRPGGTRDGAALQPHGAHAAPGALDDATRSEIKRFYGEVFGWNALDVPILGQQGLLLRTDAETSQFVLIVESKKPVSVPGYDHLGLLLDTRAEVDRALDAIRAGARATSACRSRSTRISCRATSRSTRFTCVTCCRSGSTCSAWSGRPARARAALVVRLISASIL
jgi:hypothetical protein